MISIIIPCYNGASLLKQSLETWGRQALAAEEFELIVVDNHSSENILDVVAGSGLKNIKYLFEPVPGATNARHTGAKAAKGDILVFADNDGLYNPECLTAIKDAFNQMPEAGAVACKIELQWDKTPPGWIVPYAFMLGQLDYGPELKMGYNLYFNSGLFAIKGDIFERLGGFNPDLMGGKIIGDGDTGLVKKLWNAHIPIGWTPFAVMKHLQQVDRHGTMEGVGLHFYNVGVANSYALFRKNGFKNNGTVLKYRLLTFALFSKKWFQYNVLKKRDRKTYFSLKQREGEITFFKRYGRFGIKENQGI